jgi:hypothetical protein
METCLQAVNRQNFPEGNEKSRDTIQMKWKKENLMQNCIYYYSVNICTSLFYKWEKVP